MHLGAHNPEHCCSINRSLVARKPRTGDLEVEIDRKRKFNSHINLIPAVLKQSSNVCTLNMKMFGLHNQYIMLVNILFQIPGTA
jgi:hypothetical protein